MRLAFSALQPDRGTRRCLIDPEPRSQQHPLAPASSPRKLFECNIFPYPHALNILPTKPALVMTLKNWGEGPSETHPVAKNGRPVLPASGRSGLRRLPQLRKAP